VCYLCVIWRHDNPKDPVELYSELDEGSREVRMVEVFPDGRVGSAGGTGATESTRLGQVPVPPIDEIARDPQSIPQEISKADFERV
jgi:hypothetical protein